MLLSHFCWITRWSYFVRVFILRATNFNYMLFPFNIISKSRSFVLFSCQIKKNLSKCLAREDNFNLFGMPTRVLSFKAALYCKDLCMGIRPIYLLFCFEKLLHFVVTTNSFCVNFIICSVYFITFCFGRYHIMQRNRCDLEKKQQDHILYPRRNENFTSFIRPFMQH